MRIVLGVDGSEGAHWASEMILALPFPAPVDVTAVTVIDVPEPPFTSVTAAARKAYAGAIATMRREAEEAARAALQKTEDHLRGRVSSLTSHVKTGRAAAVLTETAGLLGADLVVVGSRGLGPVKGMLLGSVSQALVRSAPCSVLVVRGSVIDVQRVLLGVDGSIHAEAGAKFLASLSFSPAATIHLCAVAEQPIFGPGHAPKTPEELAEALRTIAEVGRLAAERILADTRALLGTKGCNVIPSLRSGHPVDHLLAAIREVQPDLAVVGAKGRTAAKEHALGSVTPMVLKYASCSVLVVRP
jgi:nucleotide-binding universal stress UspA family protein